MGLRATYPYEDPDFTWKEWAQAILHNDSAHNVCVKVPKARGWYLKYKKSIAEVFRVGRSFLRA